MATLEDLETRLAALEGRIGPAPLAVAPITIGELADVPTPGSPIVSQWAQEVTRRSLHRFASAAARDSAYPAASAGLGAQCVTLDTITEWVSTGSAWVPIVAGLGEVAYVAQPTPLGPSGPAIFDLAGLTVTFTAAAGAKYELLASVELSTNNAGNTVISLYITDAANSVVNVRRHTIIAGSYGHFTTIGRVTPGAGSVTYKCRADASAGTVNANDASNTGILRAHRVG